MNKQSVIFQDLGRKRYQSVWDYQEALLRKNVAVKAGNYGGAVSEAAGDEEELKKTMHYLLFVEHPAVYTLGKSGKMENLLISEEQMAAEDVEFFKTNRGGDITFHGGGQIVGYPIFDLEKFTTDIGKYLRNLEEVVILSLAAFGIKGERSPGETGVWIDAQVAGRERKICAIGVRCSRWITMHGFALNVNTDLGYFDQIIPCGIRGKGVTSMEVETGKKLDVDEVKLELKRNFEIVFGVELVDGVPAFTDDEEMFKSL